MDEPIECGIHSIIADCAVLAGNQTLLVRYADANAYDHQDGWFVPDDQVRHLEHPEASARRILREQLGLEVPDLRLSHVESFKGKNRTWHLTFHYVADVEDPPPLLPSSDVSAAEWFSLDDLPPASEVAHRGWALAILRSVAASRA